MDTNGDQGVAKRGKRRRWSADEKQMICAQTRFAGVSVSQVARRYDVNANLVFTWLRDPRFQGGDAAARFLPVEVSPAAARDVERPELRDGRIEIVLANGHRLCLSGAFDPERVVRLVRGLAE